MFPFSLGQLHLNNCSLTVTLVMDWRQCDWNMKQVQVHVLKTILSFFLSLFLSFFLFRNYSVFPNVFLFLFLSSFLSFYLSLKFVVSLQRSFACLRCWFFSQREKLFCLFFFSSLSQFLTFLFSFLFLFSCLYFSQERENSFV